MAMSREYSLTCLTSVSPHPTKNNGKSKQKTTGNNDKANFFMIYSYGHLTQKMNVPLAKSLSKGQECDIIKPLGEK